MWFGNMVNALRKVLKYGVIYCPYFPVFSPKTGKYGPEITPHLGTSHSDGVFDYMIQPSCGSPTPFVSLSKRSDSDTLYQTQ